MKNNYKREGYVDGNGISVPKVDEMLVACADLLPQYAEEIVKAKERLQDKKVPYRPVKGFTLKTKTVEEMAEEKQKYRDMAAAAAKENVK